jgi:hypothetical protein
MFSCTDITSEYDDKKEIEKMYIVFEMMNESYFHVDLFLCEYAKGVVGSCLKRFQERDLFFCFWLRIKVRETI